MHGQIFMSDRDSSLKLAVEQRELLLEDLPDLRKILRGSLVARFRRCGKRGCHCAQEGDPGHGPAYYLVVTVRPGKTVQVYVAKDRKERVEHWIANFVQARQRLEEISSLNRELLREGLLFKEG